MRYLVRSCGITRELGASRRNECGIRRAGSTNNPKALYGDRGIKDLTEEEKENLSALTQLAIGLTIASMGGDSSDITTGVNSSKNAVENNYSADLGLAFSEAAERQCGKENFECQSKAINEMIKGYNESVDKGAKIQAVGVAGLALIYVLPKGIIIGGILNGTADISFQYIESPDGSINWGRAGVSTAVGSITGGLGAGFWETIAWNAAGGATSNALEGKDPVTGAVVGTITSGLGYGAGKLVENPLKSWLNPVTNKYIYETNKGFLGITGHYTESSFPALGGNLFDTTTSGIADKIINDKLKKNKNENENESK